MAYLQRHQEPDRTDQSINIELKDLRKNNIQPRKKQQV